MKAIERLDRERDAVTQREKASGTGVRGVRNEKGAEEAVCSDLDAIFERGKSPPRRKRCHQRRRHREPALDARRHKHAHEWTH